MMACPLTVATRVPPLNGAAVKRAIIFLHGSGGDGFNSFQHVSELLRDGGVETLAQPETEIIFPTAPEQPYTPALGQKWNVWFDRADVSYDAPEMTDSVGLGRKLTIGPIRSVYLSSMFSSKGAEKVLPLVEDLESRGVPRSKIILGGLSMGGAMSLLCGYKFIPGLAGIFALSSFINRDSLLYQHLASPNTSRGNHPPLLMYHGTQDTLVLHEWGKKTFDRLTSFGVRGEWRSVEGLDHEMNTQEAVHFFEWALKILDACDSLPKL